MYTARPGGLRSRLCHVFLVKILVQSLKRVVPVIRIAAIWLNHTAAICHRPTGSIWIPSHFWCIQKCEPSRELRQYPKETCAGEFTGFIISFIKNRPDNIGLLSSAVSRVRPTYNICRLPVIAHWRQQFDNGPLMTCHVKSLSLMQVLRLSIYHYFVRSVTVFIKIFVLILSRACLQQHFNTVGLFSIMFIKHYMLW